jgi:hypothetical protein
MSMQATVAKLNRGLMAGVVVVVLALGAVSGGLGAAGMVAASAPVSRASDTRAACEESCRALQRVTPPFDGACDEMTRALGRMGVAVSCVSAPATPAASGK